MPVGNTSELSAHTEWASKGLIFITSSSQKEVCKDGKKSHRSKQTLTTESNRQIPFQNKLPITHLIISLLSETNP
jgi:hypothetical protein